MIRALYGIGYAASIAVIMVCAYAAAVMFR